MVTKPSHADVRRRLNTNLVPLIESWQEITPGCLITRGYLCQGVAGALVVTRQVASRYIGHAVSEGRLLEIHPLPDWRVCLPEGADLPPLYANPAEGQDEKPPAVYELQYSRPDSYGSGNVSFLITPKSLQRLLSVVREQYGLPVPSDAVFYEPVIERVLRTTTHQELRDALFSFNPEVLTPDQVDAMLEPLLKVLRLKAPPNA